MLLPCRAVTTLLSLLSLTGYVSADEPVFGPPTMIIDARIDDHAPGDGKRLIGTTMEWAETRQSWNREGTIERGGRSITASIDRGRSVFILQAKQFVAPLNTLQFARLNGDAIDATEVDNLLAAKRAVVFLPKGVEIHPAIANALNPETVVVTRVSYPTDPLVIGIPQKR
jgi:hypothetical protein